MSGGASINVLMSSDKMELATAVSTNKMLGHVHTQNNH